MRAGASGRRRESGVVAGADDHGRKKSAMFSEDHTEAAVREMLRHAGVELNGSRPFDITVHDPRFYRRLLGQATLGAGESYMDGEWDCDRLDELFYRIMRGRLDVGLRKHRRAGVQVLWSRLLNQQSRRRSVRVAERHYNVGNELYRFMLGESMAYTCAYWKDADTLDDAQTNKFDLVCRKVGIHPGDRILELGCGWGTFAHHAATRYGCEVTAVNISTEQVAFAREKCRDLPVQVHLCDYRDVGRYNPNGVLFDHVVSIGLCEHVGYKNYLRLMQIARKNLKEDGLFLLHTIGSNVSVHSVDPWIDRYIFPGGMLPSLAQLSLASEGSFVLEDLHSFGPDYDRTLMAWHENFERHWEDLNQRYDDRFRRMWRYYLLSCAGGFRARAMQLWQVVFSHRGVSGGYRAVR